MSANDNLKAVQSAYEGFERDDREPLRSILAENFEHTNYESNPFGGSFRGPEGFEHLSAVLAQVDMDHFDVETIVADDDQVVSVLDVGYTVKSTGKRSAPGPTVHIMDFRDGR